MEKKFIGWESNKEKLGVTFRIPTPLLAFTPAFTEENGESLLQVSCVVADPTSDTIQVRGYKKRVPFTTPYELPAERLYAVPTIVVELGVPYVDWLIVETVQPERHGLKVVPAGQG